MALALKTLCLIQFLNWVNSLFPLLALWGNKNWATSMKVKKLETYQNKSCSRGCKWSSLNSPGTQIPLSPLYLEFGKSPFLLRPCAELFNGDSPRHSPFDCSSAFNATISPSPTKPRIAPKFEDVALREGEDDGEAPRRRQHPVRPRRGAAHRERLQDRQEPERGWI